MNIRVNADVIKNLNLHKFYFEKYVRFHKDLEIDLIDFLKSDKIEMHPDQKISIAIQLIPKELLEIFIIDCAFSVVSSFGHRDAIEAEIYQDPEIDYTNLIGYANVYSGYASYVAGSFPLSVSKYIPEAKADAAVKATPETAAEHAYMYCVINSAYDASIIEENRQIETLIYLIENEE